MGTTKGGRKHNTNDGVPPDSPHVKTPKRDSKFSRKKLWHFLVTTGPVMTVIALLFAAYQSYKSYESAQDVKQIASSVSTRYVGVFPDNMPEIIELLKQAKKRIIVVVDVAAYGHFSGAFHSRQYVAEVEQLADPEKKIDIEFICYETGKDEAGKDKASGKYLKEQFDWEKLLEANNNDESKAWNEFMSQKAATFSEYTLRHHNEVPQGMDQLVSQIDNASNNLLQTLRNSKGNHAICTTTESLPIFMWIIDDHEAIFSLHTYGPNAREDSFITSDPTFISRLKEIEDEARSKNPQCTREKTEDKVSSTK